MPLLKLRFIKLYTRSKTYFSVWCLSCLIIVVFTIICAFRQDWAFVIAGVIGLALPLPLKKYLLEYYHITDRFLRLSTSLIFLSIIIIPFIFGSLSHIPWPLRAFGFFYFSAFTATYFWIRTDPAVRVSGE